MGWNGHPSGDSVFPLSVASGLLLVAGLWWGFAIVASIAWERRYASPAKRRAQDAPKEERNWGSTLVDVMEFGLPSVLSIGLALDGLFAGGLVLYAPGWSFFLPFSEAVQALGAVLLFFGLILFTSCGYLLSKYVYSRLPEERSLLQRGPYRYVRHPFYLSFVLTGAGFLLLVQNVTMLGLLYVFGAFRYPKPEEENLLRLYGDAYKVYQSHTGRFLPKFRRR